MTELVLFIAVGALAVAAAVMMLLSDNAVHSALFLIVVMGCLAFLFLLLNAPFLAMIQLTVYAGAIMVLFLFVIMLLGAEKLQPTDPGSAERRYRWFTPVALMLSLALMIAVGLAIVASQVDLIESPESDPRIRVVHVATDVNAVDVFANDAPIASELRFGHASDFVSVPAGEVSFALSPESDALTTLTLTPNSTNTLVLYGRGDTPAIALLPTDLTTVEGDRNLRYTLFNAYSEAPSVTLLDYGSDLVDDDTVELVSGLEYGSVAVTETRREGTVDSWAVVNGENPSLLLYRIRDYTFSRQTDTLLIVAAERLFDGSVRAVSVPVVAAAAGSFGGPRAIGELLFTDYMLPFQLLAVLLLAAMVGAIVLTHRETDKSRRKTIGRRKVARPLPNVIASQVGRDVTEGAPEPESAGD